LTEPESAKVGIISDTHGHLPPSALQALSGVERIIHAGDIGGPDILDRLQQLAPVTAVRGNMDGGWAGGLKTSEVVEIASALIYVLHDMDRLDLDPAAAGFAAVIYGHTHQPASTLQKGVLFLNPGSASLPRRRHPPTVAVIRVRENGLLSEFIQLGND